MKIYLDDLREAPAGWTRTYWPEDTIKLLYTESVTHLSLDHDLGNDERGTGYDVLTWIEEQIVYKGYIPPPNIQVHSANVSAKKKMIAAINNIHRLVAIQKIQ
jgi:hypothetical protein